MQIIDIVQMAKDHILERGEHMPEMYVEFEEKELTLVAFADFPYKTNREKQQVFFGLGRKIGTESPGKEISQVIFIVETWMSTRPIDKPDYYVAPSQDPNRKEALVIQVLEPNKLTRELKQSVHIVEMLRDGSGELMDLLHHSEQPEVVHNSLLYAFLAGFESTKLTDIEMASLLEKTFRKNL